MTVSEPHCVYRSSLDQETKLFYRRGASQGKYTNLYLKVVVSYQSVPAMMKTAFYTGHITGDELLWIKFP